MVTEPRLPVWAIRVSAALLFVFAGSAFAGAGVAIERTYAAINPELARTYGGQLLVSGMIVFCAICGALTLWVIWKHLLFRQHTVHEVFHLPWRLHLPNWFHLPYF